MRALIVCEDETIAFALPFLLHRAGFTVDVITQSNLLEKSRFVQKVIVLGAKDSVAVTATRHVASMPDFYDWIIVTQDHLLAEIRALDIPLSLKLKMLPVVAEADLPHLYSKIGLSQRLSQHGILTPAFAAVRTLDEALHAAKNMTYPLVLKKDSSGAGEGIFECQAEADLKNHSSFFDGSPFLLQELIDGPEIDLSGLFLNGQLVHFTYCVVRKAVARFCPSILRTYFPISDVAAEIFSELTNLGKALGANGFANIAAVVARDGRRFYIEADMRPNVWVDYARYWQDDTAIRIQRWFAIRRGLLAEEVGQGGLPRKAVTATHFLRLAGWELAVNRYGVWRYMPRQEGRMLGHYLIRRFLYPVLFPLVRWTVPAFIRVRIKRSMAENRLM